MRWEKKRIAERERKKERIRTNDDRHHRLSFSLSPPLWFTHYPTVRCVLSLSHIHTLRAQTPELPRGFIPLGNKHKQKREKEKKKHHRNESLLYLSFTLFFSLSPLHSLSILPLLDTAAPQGSMRVGCQLQSTKYKRAHQCWKRERELVGHIISPLKERKRREIFLLFHFGRPISRPSVQSLEN